jgi:hypothetical protein
MTSPDSRVNGDAPNQRLKALRGRGVDRPYTVEENERHGFHNEGNPFDSCAAMDRFPVNRS